MSFSESICAYSPIHALPEEILGQIFLLILAGEPCRPRHGVCPQPTIHYSKYPELLSHVCSSWRKISVGLCELWSHIDLTPHHLFDDKFGPRVETYVSRSGQSPLYVHVHGSKNILSNLPNNTPTAALLSVAARIRTLDLNISEGHANLCKRALGAFVNGCRPGVFTRLVVQNACLKPELPGFIMAKENETHHPIRRRFSLAVSEEQLDRVFLSCPSLQLRGLFFPWTSKAYQGLVELRLSCPGVRVEICESELVAILSSSAQLRILEFRISIQDSNPVASQIQPVALPELQSLVAVIDRERNLARLLRLIAPGSKLLDVTFHLQNNTDIFVDPPFADYIAGFFWRSNIGRLFVSRIEYSVAVHLLMLAPNIRALVLERCNWSWGSKYETQLPAQAGYLNELYLIDSAISVDDLLELTNLFGVQKLVCWRYRQFQGGTQFTLDGLNEALREKELESYPVVEILDNNPIIDGDLN